MRLRRNLLLIVGCLLIVAVSCAETSSRETGDVQLPGVDTDAQLLRADADAQLLGADADAQLPGADADAKLPWADADAKLPWADADAQLLGADADAQLPGADTDGLPPPAPRVGVNGFADYTVQQFAGLLTPLGAEVRHLDPGTLSDPDKQANELLDGVDCLLLTGGADIDPAVYGEPQHQTVSLISSERQQLDFALILAARKREMPILGICLGAQEMNVVLGGSLVQDIPSEIGTSTNHRDQHTIQTISGTLMASIYGLSPVLIVSNHHQAVDSLDLGAGLRISALSPDGVVEAIEGEDPGTFLVGVQYHPELQSDEPLHDKLWQAFADACKAYRDRDLSPP